MSAPQGSDLQVGARLARARFVPGAAINLFRRVKSITGHVAKRPRERVENMDPSGQMLQGVNVKADIQPKIEFNPDVDTLPPYRAHHCGKYTIGAPLATGVYPWDFAPKEPTDAAPATYVDSMDFEINDGDGYPLALYELAMQDLEIKISDGKIDSVVESWMACLDTYASEATAKKTAGTFTGKPSLIGHFGPVPVLKVPLRVRATAGAGTGHDAQVKFSLTTSAAGTVATNGTTAIVGTGTSFLTDFAVGDTIFITGETTRVIAAIADATHLTLTVAAATTAAGLAIGLIGTGTVTTNGTINIVGAGTSFLTDFEVGDTIYIIGETPRVIGAIADATHLTLTVAAATTAAGLAIGAPKFRRFAGAAIDVTFNTPVRVVLGDGSRAGISRFDDLWVIFPSGAGTITALDEFSFTTPRTAATATYSSRNVLHAAGLEVTIDGVPFGGVPGRPGFHGCTIKLTKPKKQNFTTGSKYSQGNQKNGIWMATISFDRDREDRVLLEKLINAQNVAIVVSMYGDPFGTTGYDELWQFTFANCEVADDVRDVATPNTLPEKIDINAVRGSGGTPLFTERILTSLSALP